MGLVVDGEDLLVLTFVRPDLLVEPGGVSRGSDDGRWARKVVDVGEDEPRLDSVGEDVVHTSVDDPAERELDVEAGSAAEMLESATQRSGPLETQGRTERGKMTG